MPNNNLPKWKVVRESGGGEKHLLNLLERRLASAASHPRINCKSLSGIGKVHCLLVYLYPKAF